MISLANRLMKQVALAEHETPSAAYIWIDLLEYCYIYISKLLEKLNESSLDAITQYGTSSVAAYAQSGQNKLKLESKTIGYNNIFSATYHQFKKYHYMDKLDHFAMIQLLFKDAHIIKELKKISTKGTLITRIYVADYTANNSFLYGISKKAGKEYFCVSTCFWTQHYPDLNIGNVFKEHGLIYTKGNEKIAQRI